MGFLLDRVILVKLYSDSDRITGIITRVTKKSIVVTLYPDKVVYFNRSTGKPNLLKSKDFRNYYLDTTLIEQTLRIVEESEVEEVNYGYKEPTKVELELYPTLSEYVFNVVPRVYNTENLRMILNASYR